SAEARRYGWSLSRARLEILRSLQTRTFRRADGVIFLTRYARDCITSAVGIGPGKTAIIPHGIGHQFCLPPREQHAIEEYSAAKPFRIVYVSTVNLYKHQWHVAEAIVGLRAAGLPIVLDLVGPAYPAGMQRLSEKLHELGAAPAVIRYVGPVSYDELHTL